MGKEAKNIFNGVDLVKINRKSVRLAITARFTTRAVATASRAHGGYWLLLTGALGRFQC